MSKPTKVPTETDKLKLVQGQVDDTQQVMRDNINAALDRGQRIDVVVQKSDQLATAASQFDRSASELKRQMWWRRCRATALIGGVGATVITLLALIIYYSSKTASG